MSEIYLRVFTNKSELVLSDGTVHTFSEGVMSPSARLRYQKIATELANHYLKNQILLCISKASSLDFSKLNQNYVELFHKLVDSITSEVGRALVGLTVLQLCIKAIEHSQSIRLHKGSRGSKDFSWQDGISVRSLNKLYITPVLRKYDLLKLNADGFMMTRSLAENYPYSAVYKANIRGARTEWINIVEAIETNEVNPEIALQYLLSQLINHAKAFQYLATQTLLLVNQFLANQTNFNKEYIKTLIWQHITQSDYAARLMEIAMHSLMQAMQEYDLFSENYLKPLSQMRSANKKHGNIGDVEILSNFAIIEAWDAKYGKAYLRDELEELRDKLEDHPTVEVAGFVTSVEPERWSELSSRCQEIEEIFGITLKILTFDRWIDEQFAKATNEINITESIFAASWLIAYTESLAQKRRNVAPIDEPCYQWLTTLKKILESLQTN